MLVIVTATLFPILYLTLELPKRIINDALGAGSNAITFLGTSLSQTGFLFLLCGAFLASVLIHGLLKMRINTMKGALTERLLRRFRYTLISRILRFPQPYFERTSQGELVSMVTAEAEPLGGLMGDAFAQPILQAGQMLTILAFLFLQSFWFGLAAIALIPLQAWLIPLLQRQINLLNKKRILQVRKLAGEIGETAAGASALRINGGWRYRLALLTDRLGHLYDIRLKIYHKKFFMKFLNNFITQLTPFFFFSIGGLLVIKGEVTIGALVAALAAFKDLSSPWKELLTYYNQVQDLSLRWGVITERFAPGGMIADNLLDHASEKAPSLRKTISLTDVSLNDSEGNHLLSNISFELPPGGIVAIAVKTDEERHGLAELLARELLPTSGSYRIGDQQINDIPQSTVAARIGLVSSRPYIFDGTVGDNIMMPLRPYPVEPDTPLTPQAMEAKLSGNSTDPAAGNWLIPGNFGFEEKNAIRKWWLTLAEGMGTDMDLFRRGLGLRLDGADHLELQKSLISLRKKTQDDALKKDLASLWHPFDRDTFNPSLTIGENLLFALPRQAFSLSELTSQSGFMALINEVNLTDDLLELAQNSLKTLIEIFGPAATSHPLFQRLPITGTEYQEAVGHYELMENKGSGALGDAERYFLIGLAFLLSEESLGSVLAPELKDRLITCRNSYQNLAEKHLPTLYAPLDPEHHAFGLSVLENILFGKVDASSVHGLSDLNQLVAERLLEEGVKEQVVLLTLDVQTGLGGSKLSESMREQLAFYRAAIKRPDILIMDMPLSSMDPEARIIASIRLREALPDATLIFLEEAFVNPETFDVYVEIENGKIRDKGAEKVHLELGETSSDLRDKLRGLEQADLFRGLARQQMRLLAFSARWFDFEPDKLIFRRGDEPHDGAYLVLEGEAGLYFHKEGYEDELIGTIQPGQIVGELAIIRGERRRLHMIAHSRLKGLRIGAQEFMDVIGNDPQTSLKLLQTISTYLAESADAANEKRRSDHVKIDDGQGGN